MEPGEIVCDLLEAGLTQKAIGDHAGIHQTTVSKLARGDVTDVMSKTLKKLEALHASTVKPKKED